MSGNQRQFNETALKFVVCMSNYILQNTMDGITYPWFNPSLC